MSILIDGVMGHDSFICYSVMKNNYKRIDVALPENYDLDNYKDIEYLIHQAELFRKENKVHWDNPKIFMVQRFYLLYILTKAVLFYMF